MVITGAWRISTAEEVVDIDIFSGAASACTIFFLGDGGRCEVVGGALEVAETAGTATPREFKSVGTSHQPTGEFTLISQDLTVMLIIHFSKPSHLGNLRIIHLPDPVVTIQAVCPGDIIVVHSDRTEPQYLRRY